MTSPHHHYKFGTFSERLDHICALFEIDPPQIEHDEDGEVVWNDRLAAFATTHHVNLDWLCAGSPDGLLRRWAKDEVANDRFLNTIRDLEPEVKDGMIALMRATIIHGIDAEVALEDFGKVVREFREGKAA